MKFRTPYTEMKTVYCNPGERMCPVYELVTDEKGHRYIKKIGETDIQASIESEYASVDLNMVLKRLENGDEDALKRAEAFYADVSNLPVDMREIMEMNEKATKIFADMPDDVRRLYNNDYMEFIYDPGRLVDEMDRRRKAKAEVEKQVVKKEVAHDDEE